VQTRGVLRIDLATCEAYDVEDEKGTHVGSVRMAAHAYTPPTMLGRLKGLFRRRGILIPGTERLAEGEARKVDVGDPGAGDLGTQVVLCRVDGELHALDALCPHEGGRITPGPLAEGRYAICPLHNYKFDPKTGKAVDVACKAAHRYRIEERDGDAELFL